jgi:hypothetical protein
MYSSAKAVRIPTNVGATRRVAPTDLGREGGLRLFGNDFSRMFPVCQVG